MASPQGQPQKAMSSRLMTMKFMQRASASSPPTDDSKDHQPSYKRQKIAHRPVQNRGNEKPKYVEPAEEDLRRNEILQSQAEEAGDSMWTIPLESYAPPTVHLDFQVVQAGYGEIDSERLILDGQSENKQSTSQESPQTVPSVFGRTSFGDFGKEKQKRRETDSDSEDESESTGSNSSDDSNERSAQSKPKAKRTRKSDAGERPDQDKKVKLSKLTSISGGGGPKSVHGSLKDMQCFKCGKKGHRKADCPVLARHRRGNG